MGIANPHAGGGGNGATARRHTCSPNHLDARVRRTARGNNHLANVRAASSQITTEKNVMTPTHPLMAPGNWINKTSRPRHQTKLAPTTNQNTYAPSGGEMRTNGLNWLRGISQSRRCRPTRKLAHGNRNQLCNKRSGKKSLLSANCLINICTRVCGNPLAATTTSRC